LNEFKACDAQQRGLQLPCVLFQQVRRTLLCFYQSRDGGFSRKLLLIRPKKALADDGNYRERRYFTAWSKHKQIEEHYLPDFIKAITNQSNVPFGDGIIQANDVAIGSEMCEEMWSPES
jgi:NAD+ synthase (glutamine-hydrolysing)